MPAAPYQLETKAIQADPFVALALSEQPADEVKPRADFNTGVVKLSPNGNETFSSGVVVLRSDGKGQDRNTTIAVEQYQAFPIGTKVQTSGAVWITPYVRDGRIALSVIAEKLVEVKEDAGDLPAFGGDKK